MTPAENLAREIHEEDVESEDTIAKKNRLEAAFNEWAINFIPDENNTVEDHLKDAVGGPIEARVAIAAGAEALGIEGSAKKPDKVIDFAKRAMEQVTMEQELPKDVARLAVVEACREIVAASEETLEEIKEVVEEHDDTKEHEVVASLAVHLVEEGEIPQEELKSEEDDIAKVAPRGLGRLFGRPAGAY